MVVCVRVCVWMGLRLPLVCQWAWSAPLHYINTPDKECSYQYNRDCQLNGNVGFCVAGAIVNFTQQLTARA